ncbi:titin-like isoform X2 [Gymnodraco acuticeps]|uniref:Titin-like isoform X2 n=1 Tax=Gymnodraco acuticeps TaxID=8218 RepID=A0A6P8W3G1_GYMAC|nr:titin-like isoform X2 [Gymnodraco acuticeps]
MSLTAAVRGFILLLISLQVVQCMDDWGVTFSSTAICAVKGSTVEIRCSFTYPSRWKDVVNTVGKTFWFTKWKGGEPVDLTTDSEYAGRLEDLCENNICTLRIRNLRESDSAEYKFRIETNQDVYASEPVTLSVTGLQVTVTKTSSCTGSCIYATLKCLSSCPPTSGPPYIWYRNGLKLTEVGEHLYYYFYPEESYACAVKGYENSPSPSVCVNGQDCNTVAYSERSICAFKGSSVDISCTYSSNAYVQSTFWFSPERRDQDLSTDSQYAGRVQILETERGRSTLRISDLRDSDSAQYRFKFKTPSFEWRSDLPGTTLTVTALQVQVITATVQQSDTLAELKCHSSCSPAGGVSYVWFKNGEKIHTTSISSYKGLLPHADRISCAFEGHEGFPSPAVLFQGLDGWGVTYSSTEICAVKGSTVEIRCSFTYSSTWRGRVNTVKKTFWFIQKGGEPVDLTTDSEYAGRVEYRCGNNICTLRIRNLRESDSAEYRFRLKTSQAGGEYSGSPGVTLSLTDLSVQVERKYSSRANLKCQSSCDVPDNDYVWYKNGRSTLSGTSSLQVDFNYQDSYSCALKGFEDSPSPSVCVTGRDSNTVTSIKGSICAPEGSSVDISCTYSSNDCITSKFWFSPERSHQGQNPSQPEDLSEDSQYAGRVQILETERGRSTLRISDLRDSDSAQYLFKFKTPSFEWRSDLPGTTLTVTALQVQVITATIQQSDTLAELKCHSSCSPAGGVSYVWFKNGEKIHTTTRSSYKGLFHHADRISCAFEGHEDFPSPTVYSPKLPSVSVSPSAEIEEGSSVTLTCSSDANPAANYTWYKRNIKEYLPLFKKEPKLVFSSINSSDSGQYCCTAGNKLGTKASKDISIDVNYAPKTSSVSASPSAKIEIGKSLQLTCKGGANPAANYTWYKDNQTLPWGSKDIHQLASITLEDKGNYHCESKNKYGQINSTSVHIDVQYAPKLPSVSVSPSAEIEEGSSVTLTCSSDANPAANYTWYKRNEDSPKASGQIFTITDFRAEHSGSYYCVTQNKIGRLNSTLHLSVVAGSMKSVAAGSITAVIVGIIFLIAFLLIRRKRSSKPTTEAGERPDNDAQVRMYDRPSAEVQNATPEPEAEVCYASVRFIQNQEDALYSNIKPAHLRRHKKDEKDKEEDVDHSTVTFKGHSATAESERHEAADDPSALYSVVNKKPRVLT